MAGDVGDSSLVALAAFIRAGITGLQVFEEWPYANQQLVYPTCTLSTVGPPKRVPQMPYEIARTAPDINGNIVVNEVVAAWDLQIQIDLWCQDKLQRKTLTDQVIALFNSQETDASSLNKPDGLSLQLADQFNEWCRYDIDTVQCLDDEISAQTLLRREKISVLVNCREVRQRTYYAIKHMTVNAGVGTSEPGSDSTSGTDPVTVF